VDIRSSKEEEDEEEDHMKECYAESKNQKSTFKRIVQSLISHWRPMHYAGGTHRPLNETKNEDNENENEDEFERNKEERKAGHCCLIRRLFWSVWSRSHFCLGVGKPDLSLYSHIYMHTLLFLSL